MPIIIAVGSGRLAKEASTFLLKIAHFPELFTSTARTLTYEDTKKQYRIILVRNRDVISVLCSGSADMGIVGLDLLLENYTQARDLTFPLRLDFAKCKLSIACSKSSSLRLLLQKRQFQNLPVPLRVASKYPNLSNDFFSRHGVSTEIIKLNGSIEVAPSIGLADCIVDLVSTGKTLAANHLVEVGTILQSQAVLLIRRGCYAWHSKSIRNIIHTVSL